jgi:hypothetical protein
VSQEEKQSPWRPLTQDDERALELLAGEISGGLELLRVIKSAEQASDLLVALARVATSPIARIELGDRVVKLLMARGAAFTAMLNLQRRDDDL